jgi:hypothetical protein
MCFSLKIDNFYIGLYNAKKIEIIDFNMKFIYCLNKL